MGGCLMFREFSTGIYLAYLYIGNTINHTPQGQHVPLQLSH
jgi:hypothetical protein